MQGSDLALSKLWAWCPLDHLPTQALWFQQLCLQIWDWALRGWGLGEHVLTLALGNLPWASSPAQHFMQIRISISYTCHFKYWPCISIWLMKTISSNTCSHFSYASPDVWNHKLYPKWETLCVQLVYISTFKKCIFLECQNILYLDIFSGMELSSIFTGNINVLLWLESAVALLKCSIMGTPSRQNGAGNQQEGCAK